MKIFFKKITSIIMSAALIFPVCMTAFAAGAETSTTAMRMQPLKDNLAQMCGPCIEKGAKMYSDIGKHWAKEPIAKMTLLGILQGGTIGKFVPDGDMSVAAFLKTVVLSLGYKITPGNGAKWAEPYVAQAKKDKLIDGKDFKDYSKAITREQASKILYRAAGLFMPVPNNQNEFNVMRARIKDYARIGDKYKDCFVKDYIIGFYTLGEAAVCNPQGKFTRAQACATIIRLLEEKSRTKFEVSEGEYYLTNDGKKAYPAYGNFDNVGAINLLKNNRSLSKGYVYFGASPIAAGDTFYESEEEYNNNSIEGRDMSIMIHNDASDHRYANYMYTINTFNTKVCKDLHYDVLVDLFKYLFEKDSDKAIKQLNTTFDYCLNHSDRGLDIGVKLNSRWLYISKNEGSTRFYVAVTCKGGLSDEEYIKKYGI